jgi:response regulator RpfG family c-di-GMP phosphodiesterase
VFWIERQGGSHFDPLLIRALSETQPQLLAIARQWHD